MQEKVNINETAKTLLKLISNALFGTKHTFENAEIDWEKVCEESVYQSVSIIAFSGIKRPEQVGKAEYEDFNETALSSSSVSLYVHSDHHEIDAIMQKGGIDYCVLKGCSSAYYYPRPDFRTMGDVDFIVEAQDIPRTCSLMVENGFKQKNEYGRSHHITFFKSNVEVELHMEPAGVPEGKSGDIVRGYLKDMVKESARAKNLVEFSKPSHFHHGLVLLLHTLHHLLGSGIGLRHLCDWAVFVNSLSSDEFRELFEEKLKAAGLFEFARLVSLTAYEYIGLPYKEWMGEHNRELCAALIEDIISGGNFGKKDAARAHEGYFISYHGKDGVGKNMFAQFFKTVNSTVMDAWKITAQYKILLPFGWIYLGARYALRVLFGKRQNMFSRKAIGKAKKRKEIYKQFRLFEEI